MRWVLIKPLNQSLFYDPEIQEPLGLEYLAATLQERSCPVLILDSGLDHLDNVKLARRAASFQPDAIGFSITTDRELESVLTIFSECKIILENKSVFWVAGGNYITTECENAGKELPSEIHLVKYEGEKAIGKIVDMWDEGSIDGWPRIVNGEPQTELDLLPFPVRTYSHYIKSFGWAFNIQGSRGCCSACKYCASSGMRSHELSFWRGRSPESMVEEVAYLYNNYMARSFNFVDEDFLGPPAKALERAKRFSSGILEHQMKITIGIQVRPNSLSEEVIDVLSAAGLAYVFMGIESDNPEDFRKWGRAYCDKTWQWVQYLQSKNIEVNAGTLLFHPDCTFEGIRSFATKLREHELLNFRTVVNRLDAMPGSFFHKQYLDEHPEESSSGFIRLPFLQDGIESFYQTLLIVLAPVEAPSMHALCIMPVIQTGRISGNFEKEYQLLKSINSDCDNRVSKCFFSFLEMFENGTCTEQIISEQQHANILFSKRVAEQLAMHGFVDSPELLFQTVDRLSYETL